jgi:hypothetical protein
MRIFRIIHTPVSWTADSRRWTQIRKAEDRKRRSREKVGYQKRGRTADKFNSKYFEQKLTKGAKNNEHEHKPHPLAVLINDTDWLM